MNEKKPNGTRKKVVIAISLTIVVLGCAYFGI